MKKIITLGIIGIIIVSIMVYFKPKKKKNYIVVER